MFMDAKTQQGKDVTASQMIYTCNIAPFISPAQFPVDINKRTQKFIWKSRMISQNNCEKEE